MVSAKKQIQILVIEDNPGDFLIVEDFLIEILNPVIVHAYNFKDAIAKISSSDIVFDAILLDITLPDKSGQELISEMLVLCPFSPIIILTGYTDIDFSIRSISQGIFDYLLKDELSATILYKSIMYAIERQKSISNLKESEKRYSDLFYLSPQPMWLFDPDTYNFIKVNKAAVTLYGYTEQEFLNMTLLDLKREEDIPITKEMIREIVPDDVKFKGKFKHIKKSGEIIEVEIYSTKIKINESYFISVILADVTEKNLYEQRIIKAIIKTQEDERYEIGGELHDNVCQLLATSQITLGMIKESIPQERLEFYTQSREYITLALDEIRNLSHRLAPAFLNDTTLEEAFDRLLNSFNVDKKYDILLNYDDSVHIKVLNQDVQLNIYRILQEQLKNIFKYAKATSIRVDVLVENNMLNMTVADNGIGFDAGNVKSGIGIANMKRRTELFLGKFEIISAPGKGCTVSINIPINN